MEDFLPGVEGNDEQLLSRYGKKIRLAGGGKQNYSNHFNTVLVLPEFSECCI